MYEQDVTLERRLKAKDEQIAELVEALESLQFIDYGHCPHCGRKQRHDTGCYVGEAIRKAKGE